MTHKAKSGAFLTLAALAMWVARSGGPETTLSHARRAFRDLGSAIQDNLIPDRWNVDRELAAIKQLCRQQYELGLSRDALVKQRGQQSEVVRAIEASQSALRGALNATGAVLADMSLRGERARTIEGTAYNVADLQRHCRALERGIEQDTDEVADEQARLAEIHREIQIIDNTMTRLAAAESDRRNKLQRLVRDNQHVDALLVAARVTADAERVLVAPNSGASALEHSMQRKRVALKVLERQTENTPDMAEPMSSQPAAMDGAIAREAARLVAVP